MFRGMPRRSLLFVTIALLVPWVPPAMGEPRARLDECIVQEVHAPFARRIVEQSLPTGFQPIPYGPLPSSVLVDTATTALSCRGEVVEEWSWIPVLPPERLRRADVDAYGVFVHAFASKRPRPASPRGCLSSIFESPDEIGMETTRDAMTQIHLRATKGGYEDEVWSRLSERAAVPVARMRLFGHDFRGSLRSFDVLLEAAEALTGNGYFVQRSGTPTVKGNTFAVGGYFAGDAWALEKATLRLSASGPARCR